MLILILIITVFTITLATVKNPFIGSLLLIGLTLVLILDVRFLINQWIAYLLILLFLGGMIVIFLYVTSVITTLKFNFKINSKSLIIAAFLYFLYLFNNQFYQKSSKTVNLSDFFNLDSAVLILITLFYLLLGLIAVVNISKKFYGSLKTKIND